MSLDPQKAAFLQQAIDAAQASQSETGVPASVTLAQAILESDWGRRHMGEANNYFGIKAYPQSDGSLNIGSVAIDHVVVQTQEWDGARMITVNAPFRAYRTMTDSFQDHGLLLKKSARYAQAFQYTDNPDEFARLIHSAGYATDPGYANKLIALMQTYKLYQYDHQDPPAVGVIVSPTWPSLQRGAHGGQVTTLQLLLNERGAELDVDGVFGAKTEADVESFQQHNALQADGIVGARTWLALIITLRSGDSGSAVRAIQSALAAKGFAIEGSGQFDSDTDSIIKRFQVAHELSADGIVGPRTWLALVQA